MNIRAFGIDFNWEPTLNQWAEPRMYANADPQRHVEWYAALGANVIQSFCVSFNGYAWYPSDIAPVTPGMAGGNFLGELIRHARPRGISVMGYFNLGTNPFWFERRPDLCRDAQEGLPRMIYDDEYLDYFTSVVREALMRTEVEGFMIDWMRPVSGRRKRWMEMERKQYQELMGETLGDAAPPEDLEIEYDRRLLARAWRRIRQTVDDTRRAIIWLNAPFERAEDPKWNDHVVLREVDWVLNESPDAQLLGWLDRQVGPHTRIIQNLCGWAEHDAGMWRQLDLDRFGLYGFAQADVKTTLPHSDARPQNQRNVELVREAFQEIAARGTARTG